MNQDRYNIKNIEKLEKWILQHNPELSQLDPELDLISNRLIDSLRFMELILFLEQITTKKIDTDLINLEDFRTLQNLSEKFLATS